MKKGSPCNPCYSASKSLRVFLGLFLLIMGLNALLNYNATVDFIMSFADGLQMGQLDAVVGVISQIVAYTWPVAMTLIGLSFLTKYQKHWAMMVFMGYLLVFLLAHVWTLDLAGASYDLLFVLYMAMMKACCGIGMMCEKK